MKGFAASGGVIWGQNKSAENKRTFKALLKTKRCIPLATLWATGKIRSGGGKGIPKTSPHTSAALLTQLWLFA